MEHLIEYVVSCEDPWDIPCYSVLTPYFVK